MPHATGLVRQQSWVLKLCFENFVPCIAFGIHIHVHAFLNFVISAKNWFTVLMIHAGLHRRWNQSLVNAVSGLEQGFLRLFQDGIHQRLIQSRFTQDNVFLGTIIPAVPKFLCHIFLQTSKIIAAAQGDFTSSPYAADGQQGAAAVAAAVAKSVGKSNVIRAVIEKLWYPITVEVLYKVCRSTCTRIYLSSLSEFLCSHQPWMSIWSHRLHHPLYSV